MISVPHIFICYRRDDTAGHTGRLRDALSAEFGSDEIFRDLDTISPGDDFVEAMSHGVASCSVFLAIVGRQWLTAVDRDGRRRLDDPADHVRRELAEALERGVRVIPVLVQGAPMPRAADLPDLLKTFAARNAIELDDEGWQSDVNRLAEAIRRDVHLSRAARRGIADKPLLSWRIALGLLGAGALIIAVVLGRGRLRESSQAGASTPGGASTIASSPREPSAGSGGATRATLPAGGEAEIGGLVYEVLDAAVDAGSVPRVLNLRIRLTNHGRYPTTFSVPDFRLQVDGELHAPNPGPTDVVEAESAQENSVSFPLPPAAARATLRIPGAGETAEIPLDLNGRTGPTAAQDRELRRGGKRTFAVPVNPSSARMRFDTVTCELRSVSVHRYSHKLTLTLNVRVVNGGRYDVTFGDGHFRLLLDGTPRSPISGISTTVASEGSRDGAIVFDLPLDATDVVLRARWGDITAEVPLRIPSTD